MTKSRPLPQDSAPVIYCSDKLSSKSFFPITVLSSEIWSTYCYSASGDLENRIIVYDTEMSIDLYICIFWVYILEFVILIDKPSLGKLILPVIGQVEDSLGGCSYEIGSGYGSSLGGGPQRNSNSYKGVQGMGTNFMFFNFFKH